MSVNDLWLFLYDVGVVLKCQRLVFVLIFPLLKYSFSNIPTCVSYIKNK